GGRAMMRTMTAWIGAGVIASTALVSAHHAVSAEFDSTKPITFKGTIKKIEWTNPHIYTNVEVKEPDGSLVVYRVEGAAPNTLFRQGWRKEDLKIGEDRKSTRLNSSHQIISYAVF